MKKFILISAIILAFSTSIHASAFTEDGGQINRVGLSCPTIIVNPHDLMDGGVKSSLKQHIKDTLENNDISPQNPLKLIIGKGIADDQEKFDNFINYLNNTNLKALIISIDENMGVENKITSFWHGFLLNTKIASFSAEGFNNLISIGDEFLCVRQYLGIKSIFDINYENIYLEYVDLTGFKNVNFVGREFLDRCPNIKEILVTKEKEEFFKQFIPEEHHEKIVVKG